MPPAERTLGLDQARHAKDCDSGSSDPVLPATTTTPTSVPRQRVSWWGPDQSGTHDLSLPKHLDRESVHDLKLNYTWFLQHDSDSKHSTKVCLELSLGGLLFFSSSFLKYCVFPLFFRTSLTCLPNVMFVYSMYGQKGCT